jgi:probable F420-dependent oxidoreductase
VSAKLYGMELGEFGVWTSYRAIGEENAGEAAKLVEDLGFGTFWLGGSPQLPALRPLLEATDRLVVATGILNVWASEPERVAADFSELEARFPGRVLLGIGIGHPEATSHYRSPLAAMQAFLDGLDTAAAPVPRTRRCLAALGPKMLELSAERSLGTHTYFVPVEHTRAARELLGPSPLLAPELACVLDDDVETARAKARAYAKLYLGLRNYTNNLVNHGFDQADIADGGSDRLIDAIIPHGSADEITAAARQHLSAGADHVCLQAVGAEGIPRAEWTALASAVGITGRQQT